MDAINILLMILILFIVLMLFNTSRKNNNKIVKQELQNISVEETEENDIISMENNNSVWNSNASSYSSTYMPKTQKPNFVDIQFHDGYRHVVAALNNLVPAFKQIFNIPNQPLKYSEPGQQEVYNMVQGFVGRINHELATDIADFRQINTGWDEVLPEPEIKSGWEKAQEELGLQPSLYAKPAKNAPIHLIAINRVQKYETADETKFTVEMVIQKENTKDQMVIKPSFYLDFRGMRDENNFHKGDPIDVNVMLESIYVLGYLSDDGIDANIIHEKDEEKFYDFSKMENSDMLDPKYIQQVLLQKYKTRTQEMAQRNAMLDEEGQEFHKTLPNVYDYSNIQATRTIFDDMNTPKVFT